VAGYDLNKLYVGSLGTVGVIAELSFKLHPLPQAQGLLLATFARPEDAASTISSLVRSPLGPAAIELLDSGAAATLPGGMTVEDRGVLLVVTAFGFERAVQRQLGDIRDLCRAASTTDTIRDGAALDGLSSAVREMSDPSVAGIALLKLAVPPARSAVALATARDAAREAGFAPATVAHAGSGVVYLKLQPDAWNADAISQLAGLVTRLRGFARGESGSLVVEACPTAAKQGEQALDIWGEVGSGFAVMRALKENLDPKGTLNPGRFVGRL
jgi:glycolate oxidase FAD binding subunit